MIKVRITKETVVISLYSLSYSKFSLKNFIKLKKIKDVRIVDKIIFTSDLNKTICKEK
tara:strand:+ start:671 stop:844 length:174 start_codon:yes stop_codon:yes gene_type:complete